jgi:hypothetical protein
MDRKPRKRDRRARREKETTPCRKCLCYRQFHRWDKAKQIHRECQFPGGCPVKCGLFVPMPTWATDYFRKGGHMKLN